MVDKEEGEGGSGGRRMEGEREGWRRGVRGGSEGEREREEREREEEEGDAVEREGLKGKGMCCFSLNC